VGVDGPRIQIVVGQLHQVIPERARAQQARPSRAVDLPIKPAQGLIETRVGWLARKLDIPLRRDGHRRGELIELRP
jgi:hypothetical protein